MAAIIGVLFLDVPGTVAFVDLSMYRWQRFCPLIYYKATFLRTAEQNGQCSVTPREGTCLARQINSLARRSHRIECHNCFVLEICDL